MDYRFVLPIVFLFVMSACQVQKQRPDFESLPISTQTLSLLGDTLRTTETSLSPELSARIDSLSELALNENREVDYIIWEGRKAAYSGNYRQAVQLFTDGIQQFPNEARLYRHRGHRYLTLRAFDLAIRDFRKAAQLFEDQPDVTEQDGLPNAQNIPLSSLQTNVWYHLGLAHFLKGEYDQANLAYENGLQVTTNDDMRIAFTYWKYMALRKIGRDGQAGNLLDQVSLNTELIENTSYHKLLMVFKGVFTEVDVLDDENSALDNATIGYGLGFWHDINGRNERAQKIWKQVYASGNWAAFGFIAAEAELAR